MKILSWLFSSGNSEEDEGPTKEMIDLIQKVKNKLYEK